MVLQATLQLLIFGQTALTGDAVSTALVRELGPTITGLLVAGRNSSGMASNLAPCSSPNKVSAAYATLT